MNIHLVVFLIYSSAQERMAHQIGLCLKCNVLFKASSKFQDGESRAIIYSQVKSKASRSNAVPQAFLSCSLLPKERSKALAGTDYSCLLSLSLLKAKTLTVLAIFDIRIMTESALF